MRRCTGYPHQGTWNTGGYWDADHGVTGNLTSIASREGTSVLTVGAGSCSIVADTLNPAVNVVSFAAASWLKEIDARWASYSGTHTPLIAFVQLTCGAVPTGDVLAIEGTASNRALEATQGNCIRFDGTNVPSVVTTFVLNERRTYVWVLTGGNLYLIVAAGTSAPVSDTCGALTCDRFSLNSRFGSTTGSGYTYRRWGVKTPATGNALREAQDLYLRVTELA